MLEKLKSANLGRYLPLVGIVAFSACSVHAVNQLLQTAAKNPTPLYFVAACLIEAFTAFLVYQVVETVRKVTKSIGKGNTKQDRRFNSIVLIILLLLASISLSASVVANTREFGDLLLGLLFPALCVGCAVAAAIPEAVKRREREVKSKSDESKGKRADTKRKQEQELANALARLGNAIETLKLYLANPVLTQASAAQELGISRQAVGQHLRKLEKAGIIERNGKGIEVVVDLPEGWDGNGHEQGATA